MEVSIKKGGDVMIALKKVSDFFYFLPSSFPCTTIQNLPECSMMTHLLLP